MLSLIKITYTMINKLLSRVGVEIWKDVPEYEGLYKISNLGNVRSLKFNRITDIKHLSKSRYHVTLSKNKIKSVNTVSVLVAKAFLNHKSCGHKIVVDHIDNNPSNDKLYNLQLITQRHNLTKNRKAKSGYTGVYRTSSNNYYSEIRKNDKRIYLGTFKTPQEAAKAYKNELNKL